MACSFTKPSNDGLLFDSFDPMDGCKAIPFGDHCQTFKDILGTVMLAVEHGSLVLNTHIPAGFAF